jgi:hypothetical protein
VSTPTLNQPDPRHQEVIKMSQLVMPTTPVRPGSPGLRTARMLTLLLIPLCVLVALAGLFVPGLYRDSPTSIPLQHGNDLATLAIGVPLLVGSLRLAGRGSVRGYLLWMGALGWTVYLGAIDSFSVQFNPLFLAYVAILGLATYALILGLAAVDARDVARSFGAGTPIGWVGGYLVVASTLTALLWLSDIVPSALAGTAPAAIAGRNLPVEPSHVLDLGLLLPACILGGILLIRRRPWGYLLGGGGLALLVPLLAAINLTPISQLAAGQPLAVGPVASYAVILVLNLVLTWRYLRNVSSVLVDGTDRGVPSVHAGSLA